MEITQEILNNFFGIGSLSLFILAMLKLVQVAAPFLFKKQEEQGVEIKEIRDGQLQIIKEMQINNHNTQIRLTILEEQDRYKTVKIEEIDTKHENRADKLENRIDKLETRIEKVENIKFK